MAAVTKGTLRPASPPGYEVNDKGQAGADLSRGDLLIIDSATPNAGYDKVWVKATTSTINAQGIALMDAKSGSVVSVGIQGEMDGFSGLTPGAALYPSGSTAGGIDTTATTFYSAATAPAAATRVPSGLKARPRGIPP